MKLQTACLSLTVLIVLLVGRSAVARGDDDSVASSASGVRPLLIGTEVPDVVVRDVDAAKVSLRERIGGKPAVILFYRGGW